LKKLEIEVEVNSSNEEKSPPKKKVDYSGLGYFCCFALILLIVLSILYWYITLPIIAILILTYLIYRQQVKKKLYIKLDTKIKQDESVKETGYKPTEKGKFTEKYKDWLIQKEKEKKKLIELPALSQSQLSYESPAIYQRIPREE
jgi:hypothetical protein